MQSSDDEDQQEKALSQLYDYMPEGLMALTVLKDKVQRKQLGNWQFPAWQGVGGPNDLQRSLPTWTILWKNENNPLFILWKTTNSFNFFSGKAHLRKAVVYHEEALRVCGLCKKLRNIDVLQEVLTAAHKRSLLKYAQQEKEDDFLSLIQTPDILRKYPQLAKKVSKQ